MKLTRCPTCHAHITLEALAQDDASRDLLGLLAVADAELGRALVQYLGLFRAPARDLSHDRALRLAREVLGISPDVPRLAHALRETVEALRAKGMTKPLGGHNYLLRVFEANATVPVVLPAAPARNVSTRKSSLHEGLDDRSWAK